MFDVVQLWSQSADWLSGYVVGPVLAFLHIQGDFSNSKDIAEAGMIALLQVAVILLIFRPLETLAPAENWADRHLTRIDRLYTLLMLLGLNPLFAFLVLTPFANLFGGNSDPVATEPAGGLLHWFPWFDGHAYFSFAIYYVLYDLTYYWMHRSQHAIPWWWALHSMHHSQRQMSCWTNDRGSYLDGMLQSLILAIVGLAMGVEASQFALLGLLSELVQNLSHTNTRLGFGRYLEKCFVDPRFHRLHHMRVNPLRPALHNCNFGQVLSIWDSLFGTALFGQPMLPTGVGDPMVDADNGRGIVAMQLGALRRFWGAFRRPAGWRLGEVAFGPDNAPIPVSHKDLHIFGNPTEADSGSTVPVHAVRRRRLGRTNIDGIEPVTDTLE